jgi:hypothetical protein
MNKYLNSLFLFLNNKRLVSSFFLMLYGFLITYYLVTYNFFKYQIFFTDLSFFKKFICIFKPSYQAYGFFNMYGFGAYLIGFVLFHTGFILFQNSFSKRHILILFLDMFAVLYTSVISSCLKWGKYIPGVHGGIVGSKVYAYLFSYCSYMTPIVLIGIGFVYQFLALNNFIFNMCCFVLRKSKIVDFFSLFFFHVYSWILYCVPFSKDTKIKNLIEKTLQDDDREIRELYCKEYFNTSGDDKDVKILPSHILKNLKKNNNQSDKNNINYDEINFIIKQGKKIGIDVTCIEAFAGPVVTTIIANPSEDVKISTIIQEEHEWARLVKKKSFRIVYPLKQYPFYVGCEYENEEREFPLFLDYIDTVSYQVDQSKVVTSLPIIIGLDTQGNRVIKDLTKMPHLFICGTTGSGKSCLMHSLICNILCNFSHEDVEIVLIDPKHVEYYFYENCSHLKRSVSRSIEEIYATIEYLVKTMNDRYEMLSQYKVRNIDEFRTLYKEDKKQMAYIVVFIDEYADIVYQKKEIEFMIMRLVQMARACGIHIIMATQRPSADIVNGTLKANIPVKIACKVASELDSRIILGTKGAENLLGKGDMLMLDEINETIRVHGFYLPIEDIEKIVKISNDCNKLIEKEI